MRYARYATRKLQNQLGGGLWTNIYIYIYIWSVYRPNLLVQKDPMLNALTGRGREHRCPRLHMFEFLNCQPKSQPHQFPSTNHLISILQTKRCVCLSQMFGGTARDQDPLTSSASLKWPHHLCHSFSLGQPSTTGRT